MTKERFTQLLKQGKLATYTQPTPLINPADLIGYCNKLVASKLKGAYVCLVSKTTIKKGLVAITHRIVRLGCKYENLQGVDNTIEHHLNGYKRFLDDNRIILEKEDGTLQLRITRTKSKSTTTYFYNGVEITKAEAIALAPSYFNRNTTPPPVLNIKLENIISISHKSFILGAI